MTAKKEYTNLHPNCNPKRYNLISTPLLVEEFEKLLDGHASFLKGYSGLGNWNSLLVTDDVIMALYTGEDTEGQAKFTHSALRNSQKGIDLTNRDLRCSNLTGAIFEEQDFSHSDIHNSMGTDSLFTGSSFAGCNLKNSDFSRSIFQHCNFQDANLSGVDFEDCDLRGADFTGANIKNVSFTGAYLDDCIGLEEEKEEKKERVDYGDTSSMKEYSLSEIDLVNTYIAATFSFKTVWKDAAFITHFMTSHPDFDYEKFMDREAAIEGFPEFISGGTYYEKVEEVQNPKVIDFLNELNSELTIFRRAVADYYKDNVQEILTYIQATVPKLWPQWLPDDDKEIYVMEMQDGGLIHLFDNYDVEEQFEACKEIRALVLFANNLDDYSYFLNPDSLTHLQYICLSENNYENMPWELFSIDTLEHISMSKNHLFEIPDSIGLLVNLRYLDLSHNNIEFIGKNIGALQKLEYLNLKGNKLSESAIAEVQKLLPNCEIVL